jgi:hypothetical protein
MNDRSGLERPAAGKSIQALIEFWLQVFVGGDKQ